MLISQDTCVRANQSGWGTASDGEIWVKTIGANAVLSIVSNKAVVSTSASTATFVVPLGSGKANSGDFLVRFKPSAGTDFQGFTFAYVDVNNYCFTEVVNNGIRIHKVIAGVDTQLINATGFTITGGSSYWQHLNVSGNTAQLRVWADGNSEPLTWNATFTASALGNIGQYGLHGFVNNTADTISFDSFSFTRTPSIYYVSTYGNDANPGTQSQPFLTLQYAFNLVQPGDTLYALSGAYNQPSGSILTSNGSGTPLAGISYISAAYRGALIRSSGYVSTPIVGTSPQQYTLSGAQYTWYNTGNYATIQGFDLSGDGRIGLLNQGNYCNIKQVYTHDIPATNNYPSGGAGIDISNGGNGGQHCSVDSCTVVNIGTGTDDQVHGFYQAAQYGTLTNNEVFTVSGYGIHMFHDPSNSVAENNLVVNAQTGSVVLGGDAAGTAVSNCAVRNNILMYTPHVHGPLQYSNFVGTGNTFDHNCVWGGVTTNYAGSPQIVDTNRVFADPLFVDFQLDGSGDYHFLPNSPCISAGTSTGAPSTDFDGKARPYGGAYDIGPYEFIPSGITIVLAGRGISSYVQEETIKITDTLGQGAGVGGGAAGRASTCSFLTTLGPAASAVGAGTHITSPQLVREGEISIYDSTGITIFGGFVGKLTDKTDKTRVYTQVDCYDYYQQLDRYQVQKLYTGASDIFMIRDLLTTYAPWVDISGLPTLGNYTFTVRNFKAITLQKVISQITDVTGFQFWIDAYKKAHYVTPMQSQTAPFSLSNSPDFVNSFQSKVTDFTTDDNAAINRVTFQGGKRASDNFTQDLSTQANGSNKLFVLAFYPRKDSLGTITVVAQNINSGNALAVGYLLGTGAANTLKSKGGNADVLLNADAHTLQFDVAPTNTGANSVTATYRYEFPLIIQLTDQKSYQYYGQYFDGIISDDTIYDAPTAAGRCRTLLTEQSFGLTTLKVQCWKSGIQSGMVLKVIDAIRGINNSYIVQQVDIIPLGAGNFQYNIQLGAWNWNMVDVFMNSIKAAEAANIPNTSNNEDLSINAITISQMLESVGIHVSWSTSTKAAGGPFYARSAPVGDGHDSYPGFCTA